MSEREGLLDWFSTIGRAGRAEFMGIPVYNFFLGCQLVFRRGTEGENRHGLDPLELPAPLSTRPTTRPSVTNTPKGS